MPARKRPKPPTAPSTPSAGLSLTDSEWKIMNAVWTLGEATTREVLEALGSDVEWAYTTVKTMLDRLVAKGALGEEKRNPASVYRPLLERESARQNAVESLLERAFGGAFGSMVSFLLEREKLSARDRARLEALVEEEER